MIKISFLIFPLFSMVMVFSSCSENDFRLPATELDSVIIDSLLSDYDLDDDRSILKKLLIIYFTHN